MEKIALTKAAEVLRNTSAVLRQLSTKYDELLQKVAAYELDDRCRKLATAMVEKGLEPQLSFEEKVAQLKEADAQGKLDAVEQAVELTADQGVGLAKVAEAAAEGGGGSPQGVHPFVSHILGG